MEWPISNKLSKESVPGDLCTELMDDKEKMVRDATGQWTKHWVKKKGANRTTAGRHNNAPTASENVLHVNTLQRWRDNGLLETFPGRKSV